MILDEKKIMEAAARYCQPFNKGYCFMGSCSASLTLVEARFMCDFIVNNKLKNGIEIGTGTGISTMYLASVLDKLITVDNGAIALNLQHEYGWMRAAWNDMFREAGFENINMVQSIEEIDKRLKSVDFVFIDGDHTGLFPTNDCIAVQPHLTTKKTHYIFWHDTLNPNVMAGVDNAIKNLGYSGKLIELPEQDTYGLWVTWK